MRNIQCCFMVKFSAVALSVSLLMGCQLTQTHSVPSGQYADDEPNRIQAHQAPKTALQQFISGFAIKDDAPVQEVPANTESDSNTIPAEIAGNLPEDPLLYTVNDYVRNISQDLIANMENISPKTPMGITHFAWLDSDLNQSNIMALQMAESFKHEFHQYRIPIVDFKSTGFIRVTDQGDFYLSRNHKDLNIDIPMDYILTGTFAMHHGGVLINARVIDVETKHIVASAQSLIPEHIANAVMVSYENVIGEHLHMLGVTSEL